MKKLAIASVLFILAAYSCKTVFSTTSIEANKSFVLGDNEHEAFEVTIKNISKENVELLKMPSGEKKIFVQVLNPGKRATITVEKNTALYVENKSESSVSVELNLKSNSHLSMGYKG